MAEFEVTKPAYRPIVSVFGSADPLPDSDEYCVAYQIGKALGEMGYSIANGGYAGTMEASAKGCREGGGKTFGVTCSIWSSQPNGYVDTLITTDNYEQRLMALLDLGKSGYVVLPGATGTLVELSIVWEKACKKLITPRPIVCVGEFWQPVVDLMSLARESSSQYVKVVGTVEEFRQTFPVATKVVDKS